MLRVDVSMFHKLCVSQMYDVRLDISMFRLLGDFGYTFGCFDKQFQKFWLFTILGSVDPLRALVLMDAY